MDLFNKKIINEYIEKNIYKISDKGLPHTEIIEKIINFLKQDADRTKEKSIQTLFLQKVFEEILGYPSQLSDEKKYNLLIEPTTDFDSTEPDGALGFFDLKKVRAVIELKPSNTDLDKKQSNRKDNKSPVEQAFGYSYKFDGCKWVIVSNFREIRLYSTERGINFYQKFNVLDLHDENEFRKFYFIFNKDNLLSISEESLIEKLAKETNLKEENITKEFYSKYKETRNRLYKQLTEDNPQTDKNIILEKTQKIIDRIIFISFCEDLGLLPYNILRNILKITDDSYDLTEYKLWNQLKGLFHSINIGNPNKNINKFNGGLFTDDKPLNDLNIKDEILKELIKISDYDFESELNVNILGHIFEQSISDIEEMKADISESKAAKKEGKRKKEGIYYTPEYITKYIVEQAVGGWLEDRKKEIGFDKLPELSEEDYKSIKITKGKLKANTKVEAHINFWKSYREILQNIKVLDPACGSGAFLIQVFDYLYKEGQLVNDELAKLKKGQRQIFDLDKHILTNNIYGVDLNEESVEITKLSLWLKTANKSKELTTLDENIKCGNSLIEDPLVAGKKAFKWSNKFTGIIGNGGFNIIISNPPYVNIANIKDKKEREYYKKCYQTVKNKSDLYSIFTEQSYNLLEDNGLLGFIFSNSWLGTDSFSKFRDFLINNTEILKLVELPPGVFKDATVTTIIIILRKRINSNHEINLYKLENGFILPKDRKLSYQRINNTKNRTFSFEPEIELKTKTIPLGIIAKFTLGIKTSDDKKFILGKKIDNNCFPILRGRNIQRYWAEKPSEWVWYKPELMNERIGARPRKIKYFLVQKKILFQGISGGIIKAHLDNNRLLVNDKIHVLYELKKGYNFEIILAIVNSKLISKWLKSQYNKLLEIKINQLEQIPIPENLDMNQYNTRNLVSEIIILKKELDTKITQSLLFLTTEYNFKKNSQNLRHFYLLNWQNFISELEKQKVKLSISQKDALLQWFDNRKNELNNLYFKINQTDNAIDQEIYKLYKLSNEDIKIIELNN